MQVIAFIRVLRLFTVLVVIVAMALTAYLFRKQRHYPAKQKVLS